MLPLLILSICQNYLNRNKLLLVCYHCLLEKSFLVQVSSLSLLTASGFKFSFEELFWSAGSGYLAKAYKTPYQVRSSWYFAYHWGSRPQTWQHILIVCFHQHELSPAPLLVNFTEESGEEGATHPGHGGLQGHSVAVTESHCPSAESLKCIGRTLWNTCNSTGRGKMAADGTSQLGLQGF